MHASDGDETSTRDITLSIPEELMRRAEVLAAERHISVSALVSDLLERLVGDVPGYAQAWAEEERLMASGIGMRIGDLRSHRDELHDRL